MSSPLSAGGESEFDPSGSGILILPSAVGARLSVEERLRLFDGVIERIATKPARLAAGEDPRGWWRDELYDRGLAR